MATARCAATTKTFQIFESRYEKDYEQFIHIERFRLILSDKRRDSSVSAGLDAWPALETYLLRFLLHHSMFEVETNAAVTAGLLAKAPAPFTAADVDKAHALTDEVLVTMVAHGKHGHYALDVRTHSGEVGGKRFPTSDGVRLPLMACSTLFSMAKQVRAAILQHGDTTLLASMLPQMHWQVVFATVQWLENIHRSNMAVKCAGCDVGLENQLGHDCMMGWTTEKLLDTYNMYYESRDHAAIAKLYEQNTGAKLLKPLEVPPPTAALMEELVRRLMCVYSKNDVAEALAAKSEAHAAAPSGSGSRYKRGGSAAHPWSWTSLYSAKEISAARLDTFERAVPGAAGAVAVSRSHLTAKKRKVAAKEGVEAEVMATLVIDEASEEEEKAAAAAAPASQ